MGIFYLNLTCDTYNRLVLPRTQLINILQGLLLPGKGCKLILRKKVHPGDLAGAFSDLKMTPPLVSAR